MTRAALALRIRCRRHGRRRASDMHRSWSPPSLDRRSQPRSDGVQIGGRIGRHPIGGARSLGPQIVGSLSNSGTRIATRAGDSRPETIWVRIRAHRRSSLPDQSAPRITGRRGSMEPGSMTPSASTGASGRAPCACRRRPSRDPSAGGSSPGRGTTGRPHQRAGLHHVHLAGTRAVAGA